MTFLLAITMGFIAALAVFSASIFALPTWVLFIAWTSYYLFENSPKAVLQVLIQQVLGIFIAIIIQYSGQTLSLSLGTWGFPLAVFIVMSGVFYLTKMPRLNNIPAYFLGMIVWFGSQTQPSLDTIMILIGTLIAGFFFAWFNMTLGKQIQQSFHKETL